MAVTSSRYEEVYCILYSDGNELEAGNERQKLVSSYELMIMAFICPCARALKNGVLPGNGSGHRVRLQSPLRAHSHQAEA